MAKSSSWFFGGTIEVEKTVESSDEPDKPPNSSHVTLRNLASLLYSIIFHLIGVAYYIYLFYSYYTTSNFPYIVWTGAFYLLGSIVSTLISIRMYVADREAKRLGRSTIVRIVLCALGVVFQLAPLIRYLDSLKYAIKSIRAQSKGNDNDKKINFNKMLNEDSDVAWLKVCQCYLECAPLQVLQLALLIIEYSYNSSALILSQTVFIVLNFIKLGWCMATYHSNIRFDQEDKNNISSLGVAAQFFWHLNLTVSRILSLAALASIYSFWTCLGVLGHWCGMTVWVAVTTKTNFCGKNLILETFFASSMGLVYVFNFISLKEGPTRHFYYVFYGVCLVENLIISTLWGLNSFLPSKSNWVYLFFLIVPILTYLISVLMAIFYYNCLHPNVLKSDSNTKTIFSQFTFFK